MAVQKLAVAEADRYVQTNAVRMEIPGAVEAAGLYCIDGRNPETGVAVPGGALGVSGTILAAIYRDLIFDWVTFEDNRRLQIVRDRLQFEELMAFFESHFNGMSCHTDDGHHSSDKQHLACAGCGHLMLLMTEPRYRLGDFTEPFKEYAASLKARNEKGDPRVVIAKYHGTHKEQAVIRVKTNGLNGHVISLRPTDGSTSVFVVNEAMGLAVHRRAAALCHEHFKRTFEMLGVSKTELLGYVQSTLHRHTRLSAMKLARGLPVYDVREQVAGQLVISSSNLNFN